MVVRKNPINGIEPGEKVGAGSYSEIIALLFDQTRRRRYAADADLLKKN
jgi:hypothetical protein